MPANPKLCRVCRRPLSEKRNPWESPFGFTGRTGSEHSSCASERIGAKRREMLEAKRKEEARLLAVVAKKRRAKR